MSGRRTVRNEGTNSRGNWYRAYDDGAYRYKNTDGGRYFNDGRDHGFYKSVYSRDNCFADNQTLWTLYLFWFIVCQTHNISRSNRDGTEASGGESYSRYYDYKSGRESENLTAGTMTTSPAQPALTPETRQELQAPTLRGLSGSTGTISSF